MYFLRIVEIYIVLNAGPQLRQTDIIFDFDVFVFQRPPETLHFGIIAAASAPVHADLNVVSRKHFPAASFSIAEPNSDEFDTYRRFQRRSNPPATLQMPPDF